MTNITFYLAGPLYDCKPKELLWRKEFCKDISKLLTKYDVDLVFHLPEYKKLSKRQQRNIVLGDCQLIRQSDIVIANAFKPSVGTSMEIMYCHNIGVECIAFNPTDSPWIRYFATHIVSTKDEMLSKIDCIVGDFCEGKYDGIYPLQIFDQ